jgi:very-short-patch-repair endonuclease
MIEMTCGWCGKIFQMYDKEYNRHTKNGRTIFYCSISCGAQKNNSHKKKSPINKVCPECGKEFVDDTRKQVKIFCSRGCASRGSVTEYRRNKARETGRLSVEKHGIVGSIEGIALGLKKREHWKYVDVDEFLNSIGIEHEFEVAIENYVFDMSLPTMKMLVEFDSPYHNIEKQIYDDDKKNSAAEKLGWKVIRIPVLSNVIIEREIIEQAIDFPRSA